jgi:hypothetical protein
VLQANTADVSTAARTDRIKSASGTPWWDKSYSSRAGSCGQWKCRAPNFFAEPRDWGCVRRLVTQTGKCDARQFVSQGARGLVVIRALLDFERPMPKVIDRAPRLACHMRCAQYRARPVREQHAQIAIAAFQDAPEMARAVGVSPNHEAKWRASRKCATWPPVAATIAVAVRRPTTRNR